MKRWLPGRIHFPVKAGIIQAQSELRVMRRRLSKQLHAQPDFIVIGAQKAGTSSIYAYLCRHPKVSGALRKEIHYFDLRYEKGPSWYSAHFPLREKLAQSQGITGEASPYYMAHPHAMGRILQDLPGVKLIALLRNPVERTISHYFHEKRHGTEHLSLLDAVQAEAARLGPELAKMQQDGSYRSRPHRHFSYILRSRYADQLRPLLPLLDQDRLLILKAEDLFEHPQETMTKTFGFLGLPSHEEPQPFRQVNRGDGTTVDDETRAVVAEMLRGPTRELTKLTGIEWPAAD